MSTQTATLIGATGLIGGHLLQLLQEDSGFGVIKVLVRRPVQFTHPKVQVIQIDFADEVAYQAAIAGSNVVFCAVGTTLKQVNSDMVAYRKIDYDIPVNAARFCVASNCSKFLLVSSVGANRKSSNFYLKLKGEVEEKVSSLGLASLSIFRPSMLMGRQGEFRFGEKMAELLMVALAFLIPAKYKAIAAREVAKAMLNTSKENNSGINIYEYSAIKNALRND